MSVKFCKYDTDHVMIFLMQVPTDERIFGQGVKYQGQLWKPYGYDEELHTGVVYYKRKNLCSFSVSMSNAKSQLLHSQNFLAQYRH